MTKSAIFSIASAITQNVSDVMQAFIETADETRAGLVRVGPLQASPLSAGINILMQFNDPQDVKAWPHTILNHAMARELGISMPTYELGGGEMWLRRYTLELTQFFRPGSDRVTAEELAQIILTRAEWAIRTSKLGGTDDFGEIPLQTYLYTSVNTEGGGPGQFIFRGRIKFSVLTQKNYD